MSLPFAQRFGALIALLACTAPALAQPTAPLYAAALDAGATPSDAAGLSNALRFVAPVEESRLAAADAGEGDNFGVSVSLDGDRALVGAWLDDINGMPDNGSAYIFIRRGGAWTQEAKLTADSGSSKADQFGNSVSLSGDRALVGAIRAGVFVGVPGSPPVIVPQGAAYVFVRTGDTWTQEAKLTAPYSSQFPRFGAAVSLDGDRALVGAFADPGPGGEFNGAAYVFVRTGDTWTQEAKLTASSRSWFGTSVSLRGDRALVGAPYDDNGGDNTGSAYVFGRAGSTWTLDAKLAAGASEASGNFGSSVSLDGERALVGTFLNDGTNGRTSGSAYVFVHAGTAWRQEARLTANDAAEFDAFGGSVSLSDDRALIGAARTISSGAAYVFVRSGSTWAQDSKLTAEGGDGGGVRTGQSVSLSGERALISASESAYVFSGIAPVGTEVVPTSAALVLSAPRPNPATGRTTLVLALGQPQHVRATIVDALGREVAVLLDSEAAGNARLEVDTATLAPGVYIVHVVGAGFAETRRLTVVR